MPKGRITRNEWYPVFEFDEDFDTVGVEAEIPPDKIAWMSRVQKEFDAVQVYLSKLEDAKAKQ